MARAGQPPSHRATSAPPQPTPPDDGAVRVVAGERPARGRNRAAVFERGDLDRDDRYVRSAAGGRADPAHGAVERHFCDAWQVVRDQAHEQLAVGRNVERPRRRPGGKRSDAQRGLGDDGPVRTQGDQPGDVPFERTVAVDIVLNATESGDPPVVRRGCRGDDLHIDRLLEALESAFVEPRAPRKSARGAERAERRVPAAAREPRPHGPSGRAPADGRGVEAGRTPYVERHGRSGTGLERRLGRS